MNKTFNETLMINVIAHNPFAKKPYPQNLFGDQIFESKKESEK